MLQPFVMKYGERREGEPKRLELRDEELLDTLKHMQQRNERQQTWLKTRINQAAPQTLVVPT
jgi:hypothetical protein